MAGESVGKRGVWFFALDLALIGVECVNFLSCFARTIISQRWLARESAGGRWSVAFALLFAAGSVDVLAFAH